MLTLKSVCDPWWIPDHHKWLYATDMLWSEYGDIYCLKIIQGKMELECHRKILYAFLAFNYLLVSGMSTHP